MKKPKACRKGYMGQLRLISNMIIQEATVDIWMTEYTGTEEVGLAGMACASMRTHTLCGVCLRLGCVLDADVGAVAGCSGRPLCRRCSRHSTTSTTSGSSGQQTLLFSRAPDTCPGARVDVGLELARNVCSELTKRVCPVGAGVRSRTASAARATTRTTCPHTQQKRISGTRARQTLSSETRTSPTSCSSRTKVRSSCFEGVYVC
eukprot:3668659-Rhodomonas_salina.2